MIAFAQLCLVVAVAAFGSRALRGPTVADRMTAISGLLVTGMAAVVVDAVEQGGSAFLPALVVITLVSFVGTGMIARLVEGRPE